MSAMVATAASSHQRVVGDTVPAVGGEGPETRDIKEPGVQGRTRTRAVVPPVRRPAVTFQLVAVLAEDAARLLVLIEDSSQAVALHRADFHAHRAPGHLRNHREAPREIQLVLLDAAELCAPGRDRPGRASPDADAALLTQPR